MSNIDNILLELQQKIRAPKRQYNDFGGFSYRSCEDIVEALKPLLHARQATLHMYDEIIQVGERYYVKATAAIRYDGELRSASAYAREPESKKGMDSMQVSGAASSYARKYALSGLLALDDNADSDQTEKPRITEEQVKQIDSLLEEKGIDRDRFLSWLKRGMKADSIEDIAEAVFDDVISKLERKQ